MKTKSRYLFDITKEFLKEKMVFIGGPRQVGKTTLSFDLLGMKKGEENPAYLNWDIASHRQTIMREEFPAECPLVAFDEIHKFVKWRDVMKGFYDRYYPKKQALVTGSARLDFYRKGGDSLVGRYHYLRLHPFSLCEMNSKPTRSDLDLLLKFGGFPEPLFKGSERDWRLWQKGRISKVLEEDLLSLERVREVSLLALLMDALPSKVGSPLSLQSLREDLQVSHDSIRNWIKIFENLYLCFRLAPFGMPSIRAVKKEQKLYFWDWSQVESSGARFENCVASHLLKYCHWLEDSEGHSMELKYVRDTDKREVDFVVVKNNKLLFAVECKTGEKSVSPALHYFRERLKIPKCYQVHLGEKDYGEEEQGVRVIPFVKFCQEIGIP